MELCQEPGWEAGETAIVRAVCERPPAGGEAVTGALPFPTQNCSGMDWDSPVLDMVGECQRYASHESELLQLVLAELLLGLRKLNQSWLNRGMRYASRNYWPAHAESCQSLR